jgi:hypothetical protein
MFARTPPNRQPFPVQTKVYFATGESLRRFLVLLLVGAALAAPAYAAAAVPDGGVVVSSPTVADTKRQMELAAAAGVPWVALNHSWAYLEPSWGSYDEAMWADLAAELQYAKSLGLRVLLQLTGAPAWATPFQMTGLNHPPHPVALPLYGRFLTGLASRLGGDIDAYTAWNEPNLPSFWDSPNPAAYVTLQQVAYAALKAADPTAVVLSAPLAPVQPPIGINAFDYLSAAYNAGLKGHADAIGWNAYPPTAPEDDLRDGQGRPIPASLPGQLYLRSLLDSVDPGRKVWLTELGWSTCSDCIAFRGPLGNIVNEPTQADYLVRSFTFLRRYAADSVERTFWYQVKDTGSTGRWLESLGLFRFDWTPKPAYATLKVLGSVTPPPAGASPISTPNQPGSPSSSPSAPPSRAGDSKARSVSLARASVVARNGYLILTVTVRLKGGPTVVGVDGYRRRRWLGIRTLKLSQSARIRVRIRDRGYLSVRVKARVPGSRRWGATVVVRVPSRGLRG